MDMAVYFMFSKPPQSQHKETAVCHVIALANFYKKQFHYSQNSCGNECNKSQNIIKLFFIHKHIANGIKKIKCHVSIIVWRQQNQHINNLFVILHWRCLWKKKHFDYVLRFATHFHSCTDHWKVHYGHYGFTRLF